jgi:hypothetical protein
MKCHWHRRLTHSYRFGKVCQGTAYGGVGCRGALARIATVPAQWVLRPHPRRGRVGIPSLPEGDHAPAQDADASAADRRRRVSQGEPATHQAIPSTRGPGETITRRDHRDCPRARRIHLAVARVDSAGPTTTPRTNPEPVSSRPAEKRSPRSRSRYGWRILENFLRQDLVSESARSERGNYRRFTCHAALLVEQPAHPRVTNRRHVCLERGLRSSANLATRSKI